MTTVLAESADAAEPTGPPPTRAAGTTARPSAAPTRARSRRSPVWLVLSWVAVVLGSLVLTLYFLEPLFQARRQAQLLDAYRASVVKASNEAKGLPGVSTPTEAPSPGAPVAILEIGSLQLQDVVVEGASPSQTHAGPGHVAGTAAPGQPGNAVVIGRRFAFGGSFDAVHTLEPGTKILVTTTQGQVVYTVESVGEKTIVRGDVDGTGLATSTPALSDALVTSTELYGPTEQDQLTLVTSASAAPWNASRATVVVATMEGRPFEPTPQGGRTDDSDGLGAESGAWAPLVLSALCFGAAIAAAVLLYRRASFRVAWLLTTPPLIVFTILLAESVSGLLPSWT